MHRHPPGFRGLLLALATLTAAVGLAVVVGVLLFWLVRVWVHDLPNYLLLLTTGLALLPMLVLFRRRFPFLSDWYYLLPATLFLLAFTVYPIVLTMALAFTNFSGKNYGRPDRATETAVTFVAPDTLRFPSDPARALQCGDSCVGAQLEVYRGNDRARQTVTGEGSTTLTLNRAPAFATSTQAGQLYVARISNYHFIGFRNFTFILSNAATSLWPVFRWNVVFAAGSVLLTALMGLILGVVLNDAKLRLRNFYRTALIISWALPNIITIQMWNALLNQQFGAVNRLLGLLGIYSIPWLTQTDWAKLGIILVNLWLGFPFMMTATLGALSTIPNELYESAQIDGASPWQAFRGITLPLVRTAFTPVLLTSFAFNFNNFNLIYLLLPQGGPAIPGGMATANSTDILISWAYKTAFRSEGGSAYGLGSAIALIIFVVTVGISLINFNLTGAFKEEAR
jgi:arabinogalactan oligomer/maltooligosaccharide transport system permease protein